MGGGIGGGIGGGAVAAAQPGGVASVGVAPGAGGGGGEEGGGVEDVGGVVKPTGLPHEPQNMSDAATSAPHCGHFMPFPLAGPIVRLRQATVRTTDLVVASPAHRVAQRRT